MLYSFGNYFTGYIRDEDSGAGIDGILYAAPLADLVALVVVLGLTISFFRSQHKVA